MEDVLPEVKITLYTTEDCSKCKMLKILLASKHIDFRDLNAIDNRESIKDCGFASAPIIRVEYEGRDDVWFGDIEELVRYLDDEGIGVLA